MKHIYSLLLLLLLQVIQGQTTLIKAGKFYNAETNTFQKNVDILISNKVIQKVGNNFQVPSNTKILDYSNCTVTPGLIDAHTHFLFKQSQKETSIIDDRIENSDSVRIARALEVCKNYLQNGITTVRDIGNSGEYLDVRLRDSINNGNIQAPTMFVSGQIISPYGGQSDDLPENLQPLVEKEYRVIKNIDDARIAVKEHVDKKVDFIKICVDNIPGKLLLTIEEIKAIGETAHLHNLKVTAHAMTEESARRAIIGGVDGIEHGYKLSDSLLDLMASKRIYLVPNDNALSEIKPLSEYAKKAYSVRKTRLLKAIQKNITILFGSDMTLDISNDIGYWAKNTLVAYYEYGIKPADILKFSTINPATILDKNDVIGSIKENAFADIIIFDGDLENDFTNTIFKVKSVFKNGKVIQ